MTFKWTTAQDRIFRFEDNTAVLAGAGSGKTMTLIEMIRRLLAGQIPRLGQVELGQILALTYTEKAAREMRDRLRKVLNAEILASSPEQREFWLRQRRFLDRAQIGTIHGFCNQVLKKYALEADLDPDYRIMVEAAEVRDLKERALRKTLLDLIDNDDPDLLKLLEVFPWKGIGRSKGLGDILVRLMAQNRTFGQALRIDNEDGNSIREHQESLLQAAGLVDELIAAQRITPEKSYFAKVKGFANEVRSLIRPEMSEDYILEYLDSLEEFLKGGWFLAKPARDTAVSALDALQAERAFRLVQPLKESLFRLTGLFSAEFETAKEERFGLDFDDLLLKTRQLMAENEDIRRRLKERFRVLLIDEFQDTNRLQADILAYLLEPPGRERQIPKNLAAIESLEREPRHLIVFGDAKQSIYRFRGAEISVFNRLRDSLTETGGNQRGRIISLNKNFRSRKRIIEFFNQFFTKTMGSSVADFEAGYDENDRQDWARSDLQQDPAVEILDYEGTEITADDRFLEAEAIALRIKEITAGESGITVEDGRSPEPGDLTILLRRFTYLGVYEKALRRLNLPHYTVRGRGFYQCQEVWDLINLLSFVAHPEDGQSLLGVLRSPLAGINDETLTRLAFPDIDKIGRNILEYFRDSDASWPESLTSGQIKALERIKKVLAALEGQAGRFLPAELIETAIEETDYLAVLSAQYQGQQKVANVQRFIEILRRIPLETLFLPSELVRYFKTRLDEMSEDPEAQMAPEGEGSIQIMTIHQSKGLEFPIVFVPDIGNLAPSRRGEPLVFGPGSGFGIAFNDPETGRRMKPKDYLKFEQEDKARDTAEHARLFYVAATRAKDYLVFSGNPSRSSRRNSWRAALDEFAQERPDLITVNRVEKPELTGKKEDYLSEEVIDRITGTSDNAKKILARALDRELPSPKTMAMNVTDMGSFLICPRMYYLEKELGQPDRNETRGEIKDPMGLSPAQTGNIVHRLMEVIDLSRPFNVNDIRTQALKEADKTGARLNTRQIDSIARMAAGFFEHPWGRDLLKSKRGIVKREMPFWLSVKPVDSSGPEMTLTGEIDLFYVTPQGLARLVDFKYTAQPKFKRYKPQLMIYSLALAKAGLAGKLEAGLYFMNEGMSQLAVLDLNPGWEKKLEADIGEAATELARLMNSAPTEPEPPPECPYLDCNYKNACRSHLN
ncbi:MAG: UvrD-helicase domain-containing protein [Candidatus Adiutricales bacterium]